MALPTKQELFARLQKGILRIRYRGSNGEESIRSYTLNSKLMPEYERKSKTRREDPEDVITVYDTENEGFRRIKISEETIIDIY